MASGRVVEQQGLVVSQAGRQTVRVQIERVVVHPLYGKRWMRRRRFLVHDTAGQAQVGQKVIIKRCRPLSARKHWIISRYLDVTSRS